MKSYKLVDLNFSIDNQLNISSIDNELNTYLKAKNDTDEIIFKIVDSIPERNSQYTKVSNMYVAKDSLYISNFPFEIKIENKSGIWTVWVALKKNLNQLEKVYQLAYFNKFLHPTYKSTDETYGADFMYKIFLPLIQLKLVEHGSSFVHSSAISLDDKAILFTSWGGIGKTTTLLKLLLTHKDIKFLSDDMAVLGSDGKVYLSAKYLHIYPYNWMGFSKLKEIAYNKRGLVDKLNWKFWGIFRGKAVCRRMPPSELFPDQIADSSTLDKIFFLRRRNVKSITSRKPDNTVDIIKTMSYIVFSEYKFFHNEMLLAVSAGCEIFPGPEDFIKNVEKNLTKQISGKDLEIVDIPYKATPDDLYRFMSSRLLS
ncbi:hypothetical protein H6764_00120 [Candidatus Nomurabacteria bacterium]|nr:hypothetical protein [Candidatus Nomurabacteria bacterium]